MFYVACKSIFDTSYSPHEKTPLVYHRVYDIPLPENHRFPGSKYSVLLKILESEGLIKSFLKYSPKPATAATIVNCS